MAISLLRRLLCVVWNVTVFAYFSEQLCYTGCVDSPLPPPIRCLAVACEMLKALDAKRLSPTLQTLVDTLVCFIHSQWKTLLIILYVCQFLLTTSKHEINSKNWYFVEIFIRT